MGRALQQWQLDGLQYSHGVFFLIGDQHGPIDLPPRLHGLRLAGRHLGRTDRPDDRWRLQLWPSAQERPARVVRAFTLDGTSRS